MTVRKLVLADLVMLIKDATRSALASRTLQAREGTSATSRLSPTQTALRLSGSMTPSVPRWIKWRVQESDLDPETAGPHLLELKGRGGRYKPLAEWVKDEENLRDVAVAIVDMEYGVEDGNRYLIETQEDELREHFGLEPFERRGPIIHKPSPV